MAAVFKKTFTKPLPPGAETFIRKGERLARWKDARGRTRTEKVTTGKDGAERIIVEAATYTAKYRDGSGIVREVATGCRDETAARAVLAELVKRRELVKGRILTPAQDAVIDHQAVPLADHMAAYAAYLAAKGVTAGRQKESLRYLRWLAGACGFKRLADLDRSAVERLLARLTAEGKSAAVRNEYRKAVVAFCNWCVSDRRLVTNPLAGIPKANEKADRRRQRRALTADELRRLLDVSRRRPMLEAMTVRRGKRKGERYADLREETKARLERLGRERALIYKTLVLTGLRKGELASLTVGQLDLDGPTPYVVLRPADEKNRKGSDIPLRHDLAADLREWVSDMRRRLLGRPGASGGSLPLRLPPDTPLFTVPAALSKILDRDLVHAGIARKVKDPETAKERIDKTDDGGRTIDVHALRTTFCTHLNKAGVAPRTAQAAMRHASMDLTMGAYTDLQLLDVAGAMETLPDLPLDGTGESGQARATGTDGPATSLAPTLAPTSDFPCKSGSLADNKVTNQDSAIEANSPRHSPENGQDRGGRYRARTCDLVLVRDAL